MKFSSGLMVNSVISGERLIKMVKLWMCFCRNDEMVLQQSDSLKGLLKKHGEEPRNIVTDKLRSYGVAHRELIPDTIHDASQYANNRAELSHQPTRVREREMRRFISMVQAQRFLAVHATVYNLFNLGRHFISPSHYRLMRLRAFASWKSAVI